MNPIKNWELPSLWHCPRPLWYVGFSTLLLYALTKLLWPEAAKIAETTSAILGIVALLIWGKQLRYSAALWLLLAAVAVQILSWTLGYFDHPQWVTRNPQVDRLGKLFIFIALAWWLGGSTRNTLLVWSLAAAGFFATTLVQGGGIDEWRRGLDGMRVDFDIRNAQHTAMFFGTVLLGLVIFARRMVHPAGRWLPLRTLLWLLLSAACLTGIVITQTRAIWLALCAALPVAGLLWAGASMQSSGAAQAKKPLLAGLALCVLVALPASVFFKDVVERRLGVEAAIIGEVLNGNLEQVPYSSVGIRVHTWVAAAQWIAERPLVGWGDKGRTLAIKHTEWLPEDVRNDFGHLHNYFLELWVAYGLLGLALFTALAGWVGLGTWRAWRAGAMPGDLALFGYTFFVYWLVVNQFESYNSFGTGVYVHNLIVAGLVTHIWKHRQQQLIPATQP